ncbi:hypothetical protein AVEN_235613-1 [Araneus ventricosus]|uniref:Uncharacterized protein n=1 Tax=Araneus ventricosus TaxID=182803 RepID=A0A4Y2BR42_ARAVE|nr:hypothetical protein AVEN_235613-1 [Araneus ventricosus]
MVYKFNEYALKKILPCISGFIPYPVVYGALVDSACLIWEKSCGETGNCWYYDVPKLNYVLHGTSALFSTFDACNSLGIFFLASRVHDLYKEDSKLKITSVLRKVKLNLKEKGMTLLVLQCAVA